MPDNKPAGTFRGNLTIYLAFITLVIGVIVAAELHSWKIGCYTFVAAFLIILSLVVQ